MMHLRASHLIGWGILIVVLAVNVVATRTYFTAPYPGHNDFLNPLTATQAFWLDGLSPYGQETSDRIWQRMFGGPPAPGQDPNLFAYPLFATLMLTPFMWMPYDWSSALWMVTLEVCLIAALALTLDLFKYRPRPLLMALLILFALLYYPAARGLILGQMGHVCYLLQALTLWALVKNRDRLAGIALGVAMFKPQMIYLLVPFLLLWAIQQRRWQFVGWFVGVFAGLVAFSFIVYPAWFGEWLRRLSLYPGYTLGSPVFITTQLYLGLGSAGEWVVSGILYAVVLWSWYTVLVQKHEERWLWTVVWTLVVLHVVAPRTAAPHFVVFTIPLIFYCRHFQRTTPRRAGLYTTLMLLAFLLIPWVHFVTTVGGVVKETEHPTTHLLLPFTFLALLWLTRRTWWSAPPVLQPAS